MASTSSKPRKGSKKRKEPKRAGYWALLRAVPKTVAKFGFRGLTYRALADEAGVTYGLISYHFGTREALIEEAAKLAVEEAIVGSTLVPESGEIDDFSSGLTRLIREDAAGQAFQFDLVTESLRNRKLHPPVMKLYTRYISATEEALREFGIDDDPYLARVIFASLDGLTLQQFIFEDEAETEKAIARLREIIAAVAASR
ncbi:MAG: TetR family transcriptional regulator [Actinobacteria bacterium]|nr:TetR family transcriptional regulator [Actinomycetota bacterium]